MGPRDLEPSARVEIERLRAQLAQLQRAYEQAHRLLTGLERLGQQNLLWDGTPETFLALVAQIRQAFDYRAVALWAFDNSLHAAVPPDATFSVQVPDEADAAFANREPILTSVADQTILIVPLAHESERVGVLAIDLGDEPARDPVDLWRTLRIQLALILVEGKRMAEIREMQQRQQVLYEFARSLTPGLELDEMLEHVLTLAIPSTGAHSGSVMLLDDQNQVTHYILTRKHLSREEQEQAIRYVLERGLAGWILSNVRPAIVQDTHTDPRWVRLPGDTAETRSVLAIPLQRGERVRGLLFLVHREAGHFNEEHLRFMSSVLDQAAMAIENAFLLEQAQQRLDELAMLNEIGQAASSLYLNDVLRIITQRLAQALSVRRCAVFLLDETGTRLVLRAVHNPDFASDDMNLVIPLSDRPHVAEAIKIRLPVEIPDVFADERLSAFWEKARQLDIHAQAAVPLIARQRVIGAIAMDRSTSSGSFTRGELALCETIAHQAATAIENAQLYEELQRRAERLGLVNQVSHDIGAVLDINLLLWEVVRLIRETLDCYHVGVALIEGDELVFRSGINYQYQPMSRIRLPLRGKGEGITGWVAHTGQTLLVPDVSQDARYRALDELPDTHSELAVPLKLPGRSQDGSPEASHIIGVLDVQSTLVGAFSSDDQDLLEALAAQVAVAIESARLFGRMRDERATLEAILNGTDDAIIVTDTADRILFFNPSAQQAFLSTAGWRRGQPLSEAVANQALLEFWDEASRGEGRSAEVPLPDGRIFNASLTPIAGVGKVTVMQDITQLKEMDRIKSEFVSTVSHDLRSPLQVIQTSAELLPRLGKLTRDQRKEVDHILAITRRMSELVHNLLDIGRIEAGIGMEVEPCPLDEVIAGVVGSLRPLAEEKGLDLAVELPMSLPLVCGNRLRLEQVVSNLVQNAIKFTLEGSVTVAASAQSNQVVLEVGDTGIGIPLDAQGALFEKFYRVNSPQTRGIQGTGLGLAIVKSIVEGYGGRIELESIPRLGSTFRVFLPEYTACPDAVSS